MFSDLLRYNSLSVLYSISVCLSQFQPIYCQICVVFLPVYLNAWLRYYMHTCNISLCHNAINTHGNDYILYAIWSYMPKTKRKSFRGVRSMAKSFCVIAIITYKLTLFSCLSYVDMWIPCFVCHILSLHLLLFLLSLVCLFWLFLFFSWFAVFLLCYSTELWMLWNTQWRYISDEETQFSFHTVVLEIHGLRWTQSEWTKLESIYKTFLFGLHTSNSPIFKHRMHPFGIDVVSQNPFIIESHKNIHTKMNIFCNKKRF